MIYHIQTYCTYGYWPEDLSPRSSRKPIITACDTCGRIRITTKHDYSKLCRKCGAIKRGKETVVSDKTKEKMSNSHLKRYAKMDNPGEQICGHHIAYDFNRPEAFIVYIKRRFHTKIHNPKGQGVHQRGYSLID